jgi:hypothetical protein
MRQALLSFNPRGDTPYESGAPKEAAEPTRKNLALERLTGRWEVRRLDRDADAEDKQRDEIGWLGPEDQTFAKLLAENERVAPSAPEMGKTEAL